VGSGTLEKLTEHVLGDNNIVESIKMLVANNETKNNPIPYSGDKIATQLRSELHGNRKSVAESIEYFEKHYYELYLEIEDRILHLKQYFFPSVRKPTVLKRNKKTRFRNRRVGKLLQRLPLASWLHRYLKFIAHRSNKTIATLTKISIPFFETDMQNRLKKAVRYIEVGEPLIYWLKSLFDNKKIDPDNCRLFFKNILGRWLFVHEDIGIEAPYFISISPSSECNLSCIGCYAARNFDESQLSKDDINKILHEARNLGSHIVCLTGGEPFAYPYLFDVLSENRELFFLIFTNGTYINETTCARLKSLGNAACLISMEGNEEDTDSRRGKGVFKKVKEGSMLLKENKLLFGYSIMASSKNIETLTNPDFYSELYRSGAMILWFSTYLPVGERFDLTLLPTPEQRIELKTALTKVRHEHPVFIIDFENDSRYVGGCTAAGRRIIHINNKGQIEPCNFFHYSQHNIANSTLAEAMKSPFFSSIRERQPFCESGYTPCLFDCNIDVLSEILSSSAAAPSYEEEYNPWADDELIQFSIDYRSKIEELYLEQAIRDFAGLQS
jgi:MoaA/NifB/PqqE/SkfB family radical SAM enzyme